VKAADKSGSRRHEMEDLGELEQVLRSKRDEAWYNLARPKWFEWFKRFEGLAVHG
jgi:hypothetical protein